MRIDKEKLDTLMRLDDKALWSEIVKMARGFGFNISDEAPRGDDMQKIRSLLGEGRISPHGAMKLLQSLKRDR